MCCAFLWFLLINNRKNLFAFSSHLFLSFFLSLLLARFPSLVDVCVDRQTETETERERETEKRNRKKALLTRSRARSFAASLPHPLLDYYYYFYISRRLLLLLLLLIIIIRSFFCFDVGVFFLLETLYIRYSSAFLVYNRWTNDEDFSIFILKMKEKNLSLSLSLFRFFFFSGYNDNER